MRQAAATPRSPILLALLSHREHDRHINILTNLFISDINAVFSNLLSFTQ